MKRIVCIVICLIFCLNFFAGCGNKNQIDKLSFVKIIGIDCFFGKTFLTAAVEGPKEETDIIFTECNSIYEGIALLETKSPENIFFGQVETVLLGNNYTSLDISEALDYFTQSNDMRFDIPVVVVKDGTAKSVIDNNNGENQVCEKIERLFESSRKMSVSGKMDIKDLISSSHDEFSSPYLPYITEDDGINLGGYCLIKENKISCFLNEKQSRGLNILNNQFKEYTLSADYESKRLSAQVNKIKTDIKYENGIFNVMIKCAFKPNGNVGEAEYDFLKKCILSDVKETAEETVTIMQEYSSDGAGIGKVFYRSAPKEANEIVWQDIFSQITVKINVEEYK